MNPRQPQQRGLVLEQTNMKIVNGKYSKQVCQWKNWSCLDKLFTKFLRFIPVPQNRELPRHESNKDKSQCKSWCLLKIHDSVASKPWKQLRNLMPFSIIAKHVGVDCVCQNVLKAVLAVGRFSYGGSLVVIWEFAVGNVRYDVLSYFVGVTSGEITLLTFVSSFFLWVLKFTMDIF